MTVRELDAFVDNMFPSLLKKAADTNVFILESADKALISLCMNASENKVFNSLASQQNVRHATMKVKVAMCYNALIEKLGSKIRSFPHGDKLVQILSNYLNEGALEVRNTAKIGFLQLKQAFPSQRDLD